MSRTYSKKQKYEGVPSSFKDKQKKIRRAKEKQAIKNSKNGLIMEEGIEVPIFKKTDEWDWY